MGSVRPVVESGVIDVLVENKAGLTTFSVPPHLEFVKAMGSGAYGAVASFKDRRTGDSIAIKKITRAFDDLHDGKRILREVKLLQQLNHPNIIKIRDIYPPQSPEFDDIYIVTDLMSCDLHRVIYSKQKLTEDHVQFFVFQMLCGLAYLHRKEVVHRDIKPSNILVNKACDVKICDFGLARVLTPTVAEEEDDDTFGRTNYVCTRWYRAPEVVLVESEYTRAIDVWAIGCILGELLWRKPLFAGKDYCDQIKRIVAVLGMPSKEELYWVPKESAAMRLMERCPVSRAKTWQELFPMTSPTGHEALEAMLMFNPLKRIEAMEAMRLPYLERFLEEDALAECEDANDHLKTVDWSFDFFKPTKLLLQNYIYRECVNFHPEIVQRDEDLLRDRGLDELLAQSMKATTVTVL